MIFDFKNKIVALTWLVLCLVATDTHSQTFPRKNLEKAVAATVKKVYATSVRIWGFDTTRREQASAQFSGVVVSAEGHILTVAHAAVPGGIYKVFFTDGKEHLALGLGRIGFADQQNMPDVAMLKIMDKGVWPYAEIGWSSSLKVNEPCIGISYPETLDQRLPTVRFGRIAKTMNAWGFVESTCKMEPGDSGGPLYDNMGRVVGLHSRIDKSEEVNLEVPVDLYRKYWTALQKEEDYKTLPEQMDELKADPLAAKIRTVAGLSDLVSNFKAFEDRYKSSSVWLKSKVHGALQRAQATVIVVDGKGSYLLSKSSIVGEDAVLIVSEGKTSELKIVARDKERDLVLLKAVDMTLYAGAVKLSALAEDTAGVRFEELGRFLISPVAAGKSRISVLGSMNFSLPRKFSIGFFGAGANFQNEQIILTRMAPNSPAEIGKLELGDQITGINGVPISRPEQYGEELMKYSPGDTISIEGIRKGNKYSLMVGMKARPQMIGHPAESFEGGKSVVLDGFKQVFAHDAVIRPEECGGPVFDADGRFYGMNIARFSRTITLVMPGTELYKFIAAVI